MLYLKACPRCQGDVKYESDIYGRYLECLQGGLMISSKTDGIQRRLKPAARAAKAAGGSKRAA